MSRLPQELCDNIIDHLHGERTTLKQCSLVCRDWLPSSTFHLFHRLQWPPCSHSEDVRCRENYHRGPVASSLEDALQSSPRLAGNIRELIVTIHAASCKTSALEDIAETRDTVALLRSLTLLPRLVKLSVLQYPLQTDPPPSEFLQAFNIEELFVQSNPWLPSHIPPPPVIDVQQLLSFIACFRNISKLVVEGKFNGPDSEDATSVAVPAAAQPLCLHVKTLSVKTHTSDMLPAFDTIIDFTSLRELQLQFLPDSPVTVVAKMTRLEVLAFDLSRFFPADVLAGCPPLRRLTFFGHYNVRVRELRGEAGWITGWHEVLHDLQTFDTSALREFVVVFTVYEERRNNKKPVLDWQVEGVMHAQKEHWQALEDFIQERCPVLERVEFRLRASDPAHFPCRPSGHIFRLFEKTAREYHISSRRMQELLHVVAVD